MRKEKLSLGICSVDTNLLFEKEEYYVEYKGIKLRYIPQHKIKQTDDLIFSLDAFQLNEAYKIITELFSFLAYDQDAAFIIHLGGVNHGNIDLRKSTNSTSIPRSIVAQQSYPLKIWAPENLPQETTDLLRLFRIARSSNDLYLSLLFYWHGIVYPAPQELEAIKYIDNFCNNIPNEWNSLEFHEMINLIKKDIKAEKSLGQYIHQDVRNAIAHIVREKPSYKPLDLDDLSSITHYAEIEELLKCILRYKIDNLLKENA